MGMKEMMTSYNDAGSHDKTTEVHQTVEKLTGIMQENVKRILETHASLDTLENSSSSMQKEANNFVRNSRDLRRQLQIRNLKVKVIVGLVLASLVGYVVMMFT